MGYDQDQSRHITKPKNHRDYIYNMNCWKWWSTSVLSDDTLLMKPFLELLILELPRPLCRRDTHTSISSY